MSSCQKVRWVSSQGATSGVEEISNIVVEGRMMVVPAPVGSPVGS